MEASSTTLNINGPEVEAKHNHGPNFGRYVAECPRCVQKFPNGKPTRKQHLERTMLETGDIGLDRKQVRAMEKARDKKREITNEELIQLLQERGLGTASTLEAAPAGDMATLVQLMLNREAKQLHKEEDETKRKLQAREDMIKSAAEQIALVKQRQDNCETYTGHKKENGRTAISGQIHNDGMYHMFCQRCFKMFPPRRPQHEELQNGIQA